MQSLPQLDSDGFDTYAALHLWTQIVGKIRLVQTPWTNHSWHVPLYVTARGLTTSPIPYDGRTFEIDLDLIDHRLYVSTSSGQIASLELRPRSVADFYQELMKNLDDLGIKIKINTVPNEIADGVAFDKDDLQRPYEPGQVENFFAALAFADRVFKSFRAGFIGKCSPVHFFWGSFDLAVTRFSGRTAPPHPGGVPNLPDWVTREAYSHEVSSLGFWPGGEQFPHAMFYSYAYPEPDGFRNAIVKPDAAEFNDGLGEFVLRYEAVRTSTDPEGDLLAFAKSTYESAANLAKWDRASLERDEKDLPRAISRL